MSALTGAAKQVDELFGALEMAIAKSDWELIESLIEVIKRNKGQVELSLVQEAILTAADKKFQAHEASKKDASIEKSEKYNAAEKTAGEKTKYDVEKEQEARIEAAKNTSARSATDAGSAARVRQDEAGKVARAQQEKTQATLDVGITHARQAWTTSEEFGRRAQDPTEAYQAVRNHIQNGGSSGGTEQTAGDMDLIAKVQGGRILKAFRLCRAKRPDDLYATRTILDPPTRVVIALPEELGSSKSVRFVTTTAYSTFQNQVEKCSFAKSSSDTSTLSVAVSASYFGCAKAEYSYGSSSGSSHAEGGGAENKSTSSNSSQTTDVYEVIVCTYPKKFFFFGEDAMWLSDSFVSEAKAVDTLTKAKEFNDTWGTHFATGNLTIGGVLLKTFHAFTNQMCSSEAMFQSMASHVSKAESGSSDHKGTISGGLCGFTASGSGGYSSSFAVETSSSASVGLGVGKSSSDCNATLHVSSEPGNFSEGDFRSNLAECKENWRIINRKCEEFVPVWRLLKKQHPELATVAALLKDAWIEEAKGFAHIPAVSEALLVEGQVRLTVK